MRQKETYFLEVGLQMQVGAIDDLGTIVDLVLEVLEDLKHFVLLLLAWVERARSRASMVGMAAKALSGCKKTRVEA